MLDELRRRSTPPKDLFGIIAHVRNRWRMKLALSGAVRLLAVAFGLFVLAAYGLETVRFTTTSIIVARIGLIAGLIAAALWLVVRPLRRKVSDEQVALYLEEHEPTLQATLLSAVESSRNGAVSAESEALVRKVIEQAIDACVRMDAARRADQAPLKKWSVGFAGVAVAAVLFVMVGPAFLRNAASALLLVSRDVEAAVPYRMEVKPGNFNIAKGADQAVKVKLSGFDSEKVVLKAQRNTSSDTSPWEEIQLVRNDDGSWDGMLFDVMAPLKYQVFANRVKSDEYLLTVSDIPYVQKLDLEYKYPSYTGLELEKIEDGGDIAVLKGTEVRVHITPTMKTPGGQIKLNDKQTVPLTLEKDGTLTASFKAEDDGFYRVELQTPSKQFVAASPQYTIDTLQDRAPTVGFRKPGRDTSASSIEEVFAEANAEDDYGIRDLELVFQVNGGPEKVVKLFKGEKRLAEVTAGHTFYLEELKLQVGDSVSYYARATDNDAVSGGKQVTSDVYFLRIRPFNKNFRQAPSQGGGGGGGGGGGQNQQVEALSEQQRQIISATHNVNRDKKAATPKKLQENSKVVELAQQKLREQVEGLLTRMNSELVQRDPAFAKVGELLPEAVKAMKAAEGQLAVAKPDAALTPENKALQVLQKAEEEYETQIAVQRQQQGGGGGGGGGAVQQELQALFEQELDQMASRYENASQASEQQADQKVDAWLEKLKELARKQEQQAESEARRRAIAGQGGGGNGDQQRALADQLEEAARQLEKLSREEQRSDAAQAARELRNAADALRRAAAGDSRSQAASASAADALRRAQRQLEQGQTQRTQQSIEDAKRKAEDLARQQREIADAGRRIPAGAGRQEAAQRVVDQKGRLEQGIRELESDINRAARDVGKDERAAGRKLSEAAGELRDNQLADRVGLSSRMVARGVDRNSIEAAESDISEGLDNVVNKLNEAQRALGGSQQRDAKEQQAERARQLQRSAESRAERTRERANQNAQGGQQGQQGRDGQQGQNGQGQGQQARNSQQGQNGQQGQGQQGQQGQGGQGQQGQNGQGGQQGQQGQGQGGQGQTAQNGQGGQRGDGGRLGDAIRQGGFDPSGGGTYVGGAYNGLGWGGWYDGARLTDEDIRQLSSEQRRFNEDARDLLGRVRGEEINPRDVEGIIAALKQLEDPRVYKNVQELARLQSIVAEGLKRFEFGLRRKVEGEQNAVALSGADESPEAYKKLNEQYFRSLSKGSK